VPSVAPPEAVVQVALPIGRLPLGNGAGTSHTQRQVTQVITSPDVGLVDPAREIGRFPIPPQRRTT